MPRYAVIENWHRLDTGDETIILAQFEPANEEQASWVELADPEQIRELFRGVHAIRALDLFDLAGGWFSPTGHVPIEMASYVGTVAGAIAHLVPDGGWRLRHPSWWEGDDDAPSTPLPELFAFLRERVVQLPEGELHVFPDGSAVLEAELFWVPADSRGCPVDV